MLFFILNVLDFLAGVSFILVLNGYQLGFADFLAYYLIAKGLFTMALGFGSK